MNNTSILNRVFSKRVLMDLIENNDSIVVTKVVKRYLSDYDNLCNRELISQIYNVMLSTHRNEYIYKNTLLNNLLLGRHSIRTTTALTEVPIRKSKADFILINGSATLYEIKSDLDSLERLKSQLDDYYKAFSKVVVITSESQCNKVINFLEGTNVGVCVLTKNENISERKKVIEDFSKLDYEVMFKVLRKEEYEAIIKSHYSYLPDVKPVKYYKKCYELFQDIDLRSAYECMLTELKKRNRIQIENFKETVPKELRSLVYFSDFNEKDYCILEEFLKRDYRGS